MTPGSGLGSLIRPYHTLCRVSNPASTEPETSMPSSDSGVVSRQSGGSTSNRFLIATGTPPWQSAARRPTRQAVVTLQPPRLVGEQGVYRTASPSQGPASPGHGWGGGERKGNETQETSGYDRVRIERLPMGHGPASGPQPLVAGDESVAIRGSLQSDESLVEALGDSPPLRAATGPTQCRR